MMTLKAKKLSASAQLPKRATEGSAGYDLFADLAGPVMIAPGETVKIPAGIAIELPDKNLAAFIYARSGLGVNHNIVPANCVGVIDSDYRGEVMVGLVNLSSVPFEICPGDRIAQMIIAPVCPLEIEEVESLGNTARGAGGFGSTGIRR